MEQDGIQHYENQTITRKLRFFFFYLILSN